MTICPDTLAWCRCGHVREAQAGVITVWQAGITHGPEACEADHQWRMRVLLAHALDWDGSDARCRCGWAWTCDDKSAALFRHCEHVADALEVY